MLVHRFVSAIVLTGALIAPIAAQAQSAAAPAAPVPQSAPSPLAPSQHHHKHHQSAFFRALGTVNLTPAQQQQVDVFRSQEHTANASADEPTRQANAAKMREQILGVLTPDQKTQLQTAMHHARVPGPPAAPNPAAPN